MTTGSHEAGGDHHRRDSDQGRHKTSSALRPGKEDTVGLEGPYFKLTNSHNRRLIPILFFTGT